MTEYYYIDGRNYEINHREEEDKWIKLGLIICIIVFSLFGPAWYYGLEF